jgi:hypothetical protein
MEKIVELSKKLKTAIDNKSIIDLKIVAQEIFDEGYELEEMKISKLDMMNAANNLFTSGWAPEIKTKFN